MTAAFDKITGFAEYRHWFSFLECDFFKFYFPDFLWSFALACAFIALFLPGKKGLAACSGFSLFCGLCWELFQTLGVVNGTGDFLDALMYLAAAVLAFVINIKGDLK